MTTQPAVPADGPRRPTVDDVVQFLAGSGASGLWLSGIVRVASGHARVMLEWSSVWICLLGAAVFAWRGKGRTSRSERLAELVTAIAFLIGAASFALESRSVQMVAQDLWLGVWGGFAITRLQAAVPASMRRSGLGIGVAAAAFRLGLGVWSWVSLGILVAIVLIAFWLLDNLEAEGQVLGRQERVRE